MPLHRQLLDSTSAQSIELLDRRLVLNSPPGEGQGQPAQTPPAESRVRRRLLQLAESTLSEHQAVAEIFTTGIMTKTVWKCFHSSRCPYLRQHFEGW